MSNVTLTDLRNMVEQLNELNYRPTTPDKVGHLFLERWSPGDGWTRYRLAEIVSSGGAVGYPITERSFGKREMYAHLLALLNCKSL